MKNLSLAIAVISGLWLLSCSKGGTAPGPGPGPTPNTTWTFGTPQTVVGDPFQFIDPSHLRAGYMSWQVASVTSNAIVTKVSLNNTSLFAYLLTANGSSTFNATISNPLDNPNSITAACFTTDPQGAFLYVSDGSAVLDYATDEFSGPHFLYKVNLATKAVTPIAGGLGYGRCMKVVASGVVAMTSDTLNGALLQITDNGAVTVLASGFGGVPSIFDVYNNDYYVVVNGVTSGSVVKVSSSGALTTVLNNLNAPNNLCFDQHGHFVLGVTSMQPVGASDFPFTQFAIYSPSGTKLQDVEDENGNPIVCVQGANFFSPLFVDGNNNLFFNQFGGATQGTDNPYESGPTVLKLSMTQQ